MNPYYKRGRRKRKKTRENLGTYDDNTNLEDFYNNPNWFNRELWEFGL
jgi:hypothetical protein